VCSQPEGGHMGPPLQELYYLFDRILRPLRKSLEK